MPIIVGVGRSGTTLLRLMLDAHPALAIPPETGFLEPATRLSSAAEDAREAFFRTVTGVPHWVDSQVPAAAFHEALRRLPAFTVAEGLRCFYRLYAARYGKPRWGDKTPPYGQCMDRIGRCLPEAHFIHIVRDGRDVALSLRQVWFAPGHDIELLARYWRDCVETTHRLARRCAHYLELRLDDLVADPPGELRRICEFLRLDFDPAMERYHLHARQRLGEITDRHDAEGRLIVTKAQRLAQHARTSQPPDPGRLGRWKSELPPDERARFEAVAGPLLRRLGYECAR
jgi:Sulfotransferase family